MKNPKVYLAGLLLSLLLGCASEPEPSKVPPPNTTTPAASAVPVVETPPAPAAKSVTTPAPAAPAMMRDNSSYDLGESSRGLEKKNEAAEPQRQDKSGSGDDMERLD